ncbi:MAG: hypothetical protein WD208_03670 [Dehalococcoidia bacterium]
MNINNAIALKARPYLLGAIATGVAVIGTALGGGWVSADEGGTSGTGGTGGTGGTLGPPAHEVPPGQLVRRGLAGSVVGKSSSSFQVGTQFGNVTIAVNESTTIRKPPEGSVGFDVLQVGDRVGLLLDRSPATAPVDDLDPSLEPSFRVVTALRVMIVPGKPTRSHVSAVVTERGNGRFKFVNSSGEEEEIEGDLDVEVGDDVLIIARRRGEGGPPEATGFASRSEVAERLEALRERIKGQREDTAEKLDEIRERVEANRREQLEKIREKAPENARAKVDDAIDRADNRSRGRGRVGVDDSDGDGFGDATARERDAPGNSSGRGGGRDSDSDDDGLGDAIDVEPGTRGQSRGNSGNAPGHGSN